MGRVAVVTGANKGIGYCIAQSLVQSGLFGSVILACRDEADNVRPYALNRRDLGGSWCGSCRTARPKELWLPS